MSNYRIQLVFIQVPSYLKLISESLVNLGCDRIAFLKGVAVVWMINTVAPESCVATGIYRGFAQFRKELSMAEKK